MLERGFKGSKLDEELKNAEKEAGILAGEETIKKETPVEDVTISAPTEQVKTTEQIAVEKVEKEEKMEEIKDQIVEKIDQVQSYQKALNPETSAEEYLNSKMEEVGKIEGFTRRAIDELISGAKNEEDKKVFSEILDKVNQIKKDLLEARMNFDYTQKHQGTIKTMKDFSKKGNLSLITKNPQLANDIENGFDDKDPYLNSTTIVDLNKVTPDQFQRIMKVFEFSKVTTAIGFPNKDSVFNAYNFDKPIYKKKVKLGDGKHAFNLTSNTPGVILRVHEDKPYGDFMKLSLNQDFVKEVLYI